MAGARAVIDASNARRPRDGPGVLVEGTRRLLAAEEQASVAHHVLISIVGIERVPFSYYRSKLAQENEVRPPDPAQRPAAPAGLPTHRSCRWE